MDERCLLPRDMVLKEAESVGWSSHEAATLFAFLSPKDRGLSLNDFRALHLTPENKKAVALTANLVQNTTR